MKKRKKAIFIIIFGIFILVAGGVGVGFLLAQREHQQILGYSLEEVNFDSLKDGSYEGGFAGGRYKWRQNKVEVKVEQGKVSHIRLKESKDLYGDEEKIKALMNRVIKAQSLEVDTISEATITTKGYLLGIQEALKHAQK